MTVALGSYPKFQGRDSLGQPLAGGKLWSYAAGTSTPIATYTDSTGATPNTNPVVLSSAGEADVWLTEGQPYKLRLTDAVDVQQWVVDHILPPAAGATLFPTGLTMSAVTGTFTASSGQATRTLSAFLPAGALIFAVTLTTTTQWSVAQGLTALALGTPDRLDRFGTNLPLTLGLAPVVQGGMPVFATATDLVLSALGGLFDAAGAATVTCYYATFS